MPHSKSLAPPVPSRGVSRLDDVIAKALVRTPVPIIWEEDTKVPVKPDTTDEAAGGLTAH